jgi:uncharacterized protein YehS (DUF1456 family)
MIKSTRTVVRSCKLRNLVVSVIEVGTTQFGSEDIIEWVEKECENQNDDTCFEKKCTFTLDGEIYPF